MLGVSSEYTEDFNCGPISVTKRQTLDPSGRSLSLMLPMLPVSSSRKLLLRPSNLTPVSESALEFNSRKTTRELPPTFQEMVVCLSLKKMTKDAEFPLGAMLEYKYVVLEDQDWTKLQDEGAEGVVTTFRSNSEISDSDDVDSIVRQ